MGEKQIQSAENNTQRHDTYQQQMKKYDLAMKDGFYFEAILIDYAVIEDRLKAMLYHMGVLPNREQLKLGVKKKTAQQLQTLIAAQNEKAASAKLDTITGKILVLRCILQWFESVNEADLNDKYLLALKKQCECLDTDGIVQTLDAIKPWCDYRNEVVHGLMNKKYESVQQQIAEKAEEGMQLARYLDNQVKLFKKGSKVRRTAGLQNN